MEARLSLYASTLRGILYLHNTLRVLHRYDYFADAILL